MLGWNLGHTGSSLERGMAILGRHSARSLQPPRDARGEGGTEEKYDNELL